MKKISKCIRASAVLLLTVLSIILPSKGTGRTFPQTKGNNCALTLSKMTSFSDDGIKLQISVTKSILNKDQPFIVHLIIENFSQPEIDLKRNAVVTIQSLDKTEAGNRPDISVWAFVPLQKNLSSASDQMAKSYVAIGDKVGVDVDLSALKWGESLSSIAPSQKLRKLLPSGDYVFFVEIKLKDTEKGEGFVKTFKSNELTIHVDR